MNHELEKEACDLWQEFSQLPSFLNIKQTEAFWCSYDQLIEASSEYRQTKGKDLVNKEEEYWVQKLDFQPQKQGDSTIFMMNPERKRILEGKLFQQAIGRVMIPWAFVLVLINFLGLPLTGTINIITFLASLPVVFFSFDAKTRILETTITICPDNIKITNRNKETIDIDLRLILQIEEKKRGLKILFKKDPNLYFVSDVLIPDALEGFEQAKDLIYFHSEQTY